MVKACWYHRYWDFSNNKNWYQVKIWKLEKSTEVLQSVSENNLIVSTKGTKADNIVPIQQHDPSHGKQYLGVRLSWSGNDKYRFKYRLSEVKSLVGRILTTSLTYSETHTVHCEQWHACFKYCRPLTQFSKHNT